MSFNYDLSRLDGKAPFISNDLQFYLLFIIAFQSMFNGQTSSLALVVLQKEELLLVDFSIRPNTCNSCSVQCGQPPLKLMGDSGTFGRSKIILGGADARM